MKRLPSYLLVLFAGLFLTSCEKSVFKGFDKMDNGAYMRFHEVNEQGRMPEIGDHVVVDIKQTLGDTLNKIIPLDAFRKAKQEEPEEELLQG